MRLKDRVPRQVCRPCARWQAVSSAGRFGLRRRASPHRGTVRPAASVVCRPLVLLLLRAVAPTRHPARVHRGFGSSNSRALVQVVCPHRLLRRRRPGLRVVWRSGLRRRRRPPRLVEAALVLWLAPAQLPVQPTLVVKVCRRSHGGVNCGPRSPARHRRRQPRRPRRQPRRPRRQLRRPRRQLRRPRRQLRIPRRQPRRPRREPQHQRWR
jgi:hypothetical protein